MTLDPRVAQRGLLWVRNHYGSISGLRRHIWSSVRYLIVPTGRDIEWSSVTRLIYVCKGNVCRSPFAEAASKNQGTESISFGLDTQPGTPVDARAVRVARALGVNIAQHKSRPWSPNLIREGDLVLCMEPAQLRVVRCAVLARGGAVTLLGLHSRAPRPYIHDPYSTGDAYFHRCFAVILDAVKRVNEKCGSGRNPAQCLDLEDN